MRKLIALLFCSLVTLFPPTMWADDGSLTSLVIVTGNYPPAINETANDKGYISRLVSDSFALEGIEVEFLFVPWARAENMVSRGQEIAVMYYAKSTLRMKSFLFSEPIFEEEWLFFHLKKTKVAWKILTDLSHLKIGATLSYSYSQEFNYLADKNILNVEWVARDNQNWHKLMAGRIDLFPSVKTGWYQLAQLYSKKSVELITTNPKALKSQLNYLLFSKPHPKSVYFRDKFNQGFEKLKKRRPMSDYIPNSDNREWPTEVQ